MRRYEVVGVAQPDLTEEEIAKIIERVENIISAGRGILAKIEKWGKRRLAYEIKKQKEGFYFLVDFAGTGPIVAEIERNFKIDDRILKFISVKKEGAVTREGIDAEIAEEEAKKIQATSETNTSGAAEDKIIQPAETSAGSTEE